MHVVRGLLTHVLVVALGIGELLLLELLLFLLLGQSFLELGQLFLLVDDAVLALPLLLDLSRGWGFRAAVLRTFLFEMFLPLRLSQELLLGFQRAAILLQVLLPVERVVLLLQLVETSC